MDLSENEISTVDRDSFVDIGHELHTLILSHGLSSKMTTVPTDALKPLVCLETLDLSNNKLKKVAENSFHFLRSLRTLILHDNQIEEIVKGTFQGEIHEKLEDISLSYNNLKFIGNNVFAELKVCSFWNLFRYMFYQKRGWYFGINLFFKFQ